MSSKSILQAALDEANTWSELAGQTLSRANRLGPCKAGEIAAAEAGVLRKCARELVHALVEASEPGLPLADDNGEAEADAAELRARLP